MSISLKADPSGTFGEILVNGTVVAKLPITGNAVIPGLVGTVSESGGVPTGAIIERGSNANGSYARFADGTQICTRNVDWAGSEAYRPTLIWAAPFYDTPNDVLVGPASSETTLVILSLSASASGASYWCQNISSGAVAKRTTSFSGRVTVIGRWF